MPSGALLGGRTASDRPETHPKAARDTRRGNLWRVDDGQFGQDVLRHLLYTCAKERPEASHVDLYRAMAHTVRDRLVQRWLATQRTYVERDAKRVYYLSSEFLTGRSLGLCLVNLGLYGAAEKLLAD